MYTFEIKKRNIDGKVKWTRATVNKIPYIVETEDEIKDDLYTLQKLYPQIETRIIEIT